MPRDTLREATRRPARIPATTGCHSEQSSMPLAERLPISFAYFTAVLFLVKMGFERRSDAVVVLSGAERPLTAG